MVRRGAPLLEYTYDQWKDGTHFPAGEFSAEIFHNNERIRFESVRVTPDSPKEIVLVTGRTTLYQGRVINGSTGRPMSGAIVAVSPHLAGEHMIGKKQLESLLENTLTFESEDLNAERLHSRRGRAARTDEEGFYEFTFLSGGDLTRLNYFRAMHPDHLSSFARLYTNRAAVNGVIDVPPIYVYPVATVIIEPSSTVDTWNGTAKVSWDIIPNGQTEHIEHPVILQTGRKGIDAKTSRMLLRFSVPADVTCDLTFAAVCRDGELAPVTLKGIRLSAGQTVRLGKVVFEPPSEVTLTVKVVRDDGRPVPGVGLTCEIDGRDSRRTSSTDSNGLVSIGVPTHSQGRFVYRVSDFPLIERNWSVPWQVGGAEDQREQLTLQLSGEFVFSGQVLNGITGAPEPGAFVMILSAACSIDASHLTPEHWDAAEAIGRDWNENDPALVPLRRAFDFVKIARTDTQGRYRIAIEPFDSITGMGVGTIRRNMIGHRWNVSFPALPPGRLQLRHHENIEVPPLRIYPAGRIAIQANLIEQGIKTKPEIRSRFDVVPGQIVPWADHLTKATLLRDYTLRANTPQIILLPAGITLDLKLSEVRTCEFAPIAIGHVRVTADQTLHLGQVSLEPAMPVVVQVTDTRGNPLSGVKIRVKRILEQQLQIPARVPAVTNADGKASTTVFPNAVVQFSVLDPAGITYGGRTDAYTESVEYQIGGREDKNKEFTFQLSDKMLQLLFQ